MSKIKVIKVKYVEIPIFSLLSEKVVQALQGQGYDDQGCRSRSKFEKVVRLSVLPSSRSLEF